MAEWEARLVPREEIHRQLSLQPLTRINETEDTEQRQGDEEDRQAPHYHAQTKWADEVDPMVEKIETQFERGQTVDKPKEIVAVRTLLVNPTDPHSLITQYRTQWQHPEGEDSYTWSTQETIADYLKLAKRRGQSATTFPTLKRRLQARGSQVTHPRGLKEILAGRPHMGQAWPTLHAGNLTLDPTETNPEQDIVNNREHYCQIRLEGELAHSYHRNGKYIGTLTKEKLNRLHERYTQAVGIAHDQTPHQSTLRTELWEDHKIRVSTFEEEIGHLLIRYSSKEEKEERKKNLQNHWTFPAQMQRALQQAFGISTKLFASPRNVHHNTTTYFAKYDRDKVFGARGSAWATNWMKLGAYQFNPEYTPQDLKKALDFAIAATTTQEPVFGRAERELAVQKYVTSLLREAPTQGEDRLSKKMAELQGEATTWTHQPKKEHVFRWEAHHDQAEQTEEEQTLIRDPTPNPQDEEDRQLWDMIEQQKHEEMLHMQEAGGQHEPRGEPDLTAHNQEGNPPPTEVSPQTLNEEEIFERLNELAEQQETPQEELDEEEVFERLNELVEQQETPQGELEKRRQAHHIRVTEESRVHAMIADPAPRTRLPTQPLLVVKSSVPF
eukprot:gene34043-biopygen6564